MARTSLLIALGGTGQWVATYLKKDLIESSNGQMPSNVRILAFDTVVETTAKATGRSSEQDDVRVGAVTLTPKEEFIHLGGGLQKEIEALARDEDALPYISAWFRARDWLKLPAGALGLSYGAGQLRQMGRFSLFMDLKAPNLSKVWTSLKASIDALEREMSAGDRMDINIASSLAGGTGSGMFIDFALLAQHYARTVRRLNIQVRGYFVLPRAFTANPDDDMKARTFTAWRELNRLMAVRDDFALPMVIYHANDPQLQIKEIDHSLFDACYIIDGMRGGTMISGKPEESVHPIVAEAIAAAIDDRAGQVYMEHVANVAKEYVKNPGVPFYSTLSAHSFKVPVYYAQQSFTNNLTTNWLETLLKPIRDNPSNPLQITRVDATSPHNPVNTGRKEALSLLVNPQKYEDHSKVPTLFMGRIAEILQDGGGNNAELVANYAKGAWGGKVWLHDYTALGERADMRQVIEDISREVKLRITDQVKLSKEIKEPTQRFPKRVEAYLENFVPEHYGFRTVTGQENRGSFGAALLKCGQAQVQIFRQMVDIWVLSTLNGGTKSGRLGYAYDLMDGLVEGFNQFLSGSGNAEKGFMDKVRDERQRISPRLKVESDRQSAKQAMLKYAGKKIIFGLMDDPKVQEVQRRYIQAEQKVLDVRKDEILLDVVEQTVREMREYAVQVRDELARWIWLLATGDEASGVSGLYSTLDARRRDVEQTRRADEKLEQAQTRVGGLDEWMAEEQSKEEAQALARLMEGVDWRLSNMEDEFKLTLHIEPRDEQAAEIQRPTGKETFEARQHLTQRNLETLRGYARRRFSSLPQETRAIQHLSKSTAQEVASQIEAYTAPLMEVSPVFAGGPAVWAELVAVNQDQMEARDQEFLKELARQLRIDRSQDPNSPLDLKALVQVVDSENPFKCMVISTHDLYPVEAFQVWGDYQKAYRDNQDMPPHLNHNFQAEVNAAEWEGKLHKRRGIEYRIFHPWVVMLLEHPKRLEQFLFCWALGWIKLHSDGALNWYDFEMPGLAERYKRTFRLTKPQESIPSLFQVARAFVLIGEDQTPGAKWLLDYGHIHQSILDVERSKQPEEWIAFLEALLVPWGENAGDPDEQAVIHLLYHRITELELKARTQVEKPKGEPANYEIAYTDLANVAELMLEERLDSKRDDLARKMRVRK
ncbi:MAG TPA: hypothetical protein ENN32_00075 [Chloroflexi bacterium]|nr:hypothetical protein [Chloroflexota bacterium]